MGLLDILVRRSILNIPSERKMMTNKQKRIAIAKDVLLRMRYRNIRKGTYIEGDFETKKDIKDKTKADTVIKDLEKACDVCALGSCFLSHIRLFDKIELGEIGTVGEKEIFDGEVYPAEVDIYVNGSFVREPLLNYFSEFQLDMIESAFEKYNASIHYDPSKDNEDKIQEAIRFGFLFDSDENRLRAIMKNIVKNDGEFIP